MKVNKPLSREQSREGDVIEPGIYPFEVVDASDEISQKSGKEMIKLKLKIFLPDGRERIIFDFLMEAIEYKMAHFFDGVGLWDKYEAGEVSADDCYGQSGEVKIYTQKDKSGQYPDKPAVVDYMLSEDKQAQKVERKVAAAKQQEAPAFGDEDLPF